MKTKSLLIGCILISTTSFSQSFSGLKFSSPQLLNPALTGLVDDKEINVKAFHQYKTNSLFGSYAFKSDKLHGSLGFYVDTRHTNFENFKSDRSVIGVSYAFQNTINDKWNYSLGVSVEAGGAGGYAENTSVRQFDYGIKTGGVIYNSNFFTSLSLDYKNISAYQVSLISGYTFTPIKNTDFNITPSIGIVNSFGVTQLMVNIETNYKSVHLGYGNINGRSNVSIGLDFNKFRINYSLGALKSFGYDTKYGINEISFKYKINPKTKKRINLNLF